MNTYRVTVTEVVTTVRAATVQAKSKSAAYLIAEYRHADYPVGGTAADVDIDVELATDVLDSRD